MAFSSAAFVFVFLPVTFLLHFTIRNQRGRNILLVAASLLFYAAGSLIHLPLLIAVALINYCAGLLFRKNAKLKKTVLVVTLLLNIGSLVVFKYLGFFGTAINEIFGCTMQLPALALPIGISFFTFQGLSYAIDVYRNPDSGTTSFFTVLLYLSFFPQLVAGPIVKYHDVSQQIQQREVTVEKAARGCRRFIFGLAKKLLIADILATAVDAVYGQSVMDARLSLVAGLCYMLQIYFDFSGYSDMAIGMGQMFGFRFLENFNLPYTAGSVQNFWQRWHISLSSWFREYLYIPLGGNRKGLARTCVNVMIVFLCTGFWHGANWTFVLWGIWHGLWSVLERTTPLKKLSGKPIGHIYTMVVVFLGFVLFRADSIGQAADLLGAIFTGKIVESGRILLYNVLSIKVIVAAVAGCLLSVGIHKKLTPCMDRFQAVSYVGVLILFVLCILRLASASFNPFIYFRF